MNKNNSHRELYDMALDESTSIKEIPKECEVCKWKEVKYEITANKWYSNRFICWECYQEYLAFNRANVFAKKDREDEAAAEAARIAWEESKKVLEDQQANGDVV